jgi:hypothetical protein
MLFQSNFLKLFFINYLLLINDLFNYKLNIFILSHLMVSSLTSENYNLVSPDHFMNLLYKNKLNNL